MSKFLTTLRVEKQRDGQWKLIDSLRYLTGIELLCSNCDRQHRRIIEAPKDFLTDFASIPQFAQNLISNDGPWDAPAVIHDLGYRTQPAGITRAQWDLILLEAMKTEGVTAWKRWVIYSGVRLGGWLPWKQNKKKFNL